MDGSPCTTDPSRKACPEEVGVSPQLAATFRACSLVSFKADVRDIAECKR